MFCGKCGVENADGAKFCKACGQPLASGVIKAAETKAEEAVNAAEAKVEEAVNAAETKAEEAVNAAETKAEEVVNAAETKVEEAANAAETKAEEPAAKVAAAAAAVNAAPVTAATPAAAQPADKTAGGFLTKLKALPKAVLIGVPAAIVALAVALILLLGRAKTIDMNKYMTIEAKGYNGYGNLEAVIDWEGIKKDYGDKISFTKEYKKQMSGLSSMLGGFGMDAISPVDVLESAVDVDFDKYYRLSNGDTVTYEWDIEDDLSKILNCKIKCQPGTYTVSGLEEVDTFEAFDDLMVEFEGVAPYGTVDLHYYGPVMGSYDFSCDKSSGLKNGDTVTISIPESNVSYYAEYYGKVPETLSKTYTVIGLEEYITSYEDVSEEFLSEARKEAEKCITTYAKENYGEATLGELTYAGYMFQGRQDIEDYYGSDYSDLYLIYKGDVTGEEDAALATLYYPVRFHNVKIRDDGKMVCEGYCEIVGQSRVEGWKSTKGYINPVECYEAISKMVNEDYNTECGDGFESVTNFTMIKKLADLDDEHQKTLQELAGKEIETYVQEEHGEDVEMTDLTYVGAYMLVAKNQGEDFDNCYVAVFSAQIASKDEAFETTTVYFPVAIRGVVKHEAVDVGYMIQGNTEIMGETELTEGFTTKGYTDGKVMHKEIVADNADRYECEMTEELKAFGE